ncbi:MAG: hypothetical protein EOP45_10075 [Sphingobacteriaceae bacterium]|nr:MAG: hypothetical protein EOP45_10075 [Sphingobacteriaceae bacterium]
MFVRFHDSTINEAISWGIVQSVRVIISDVNWFFLGNKGSGFFSALFKQGIKMEYEKVWSPYIAIAKKKGIGRKYIKNDRDWEMELKGVETKRRNYCPALKETLMQVFKIILKGEATSLADATVFVRSQLQELLEGKV